MSLHTYQPYAQTRLRYTSEVAYENGERPISIACVCGFMLDHPGAGRDAVCSCGREYNSGGQLLAPREQWGEETGETAADYFAGFNDDD